MSDDAGAETPPITIKKYANRRLYNTATSSYVTLDYLAQMVKDGTEFVVYDAKSGEDITRQVLTHIIVEEEGKGQNLLPIGFLRHLISFYGDSLESVVPNYLDSSMKAFARNQEQMRDYMQSSMGGLDPMKQFEEMGKKNVAMFEEGMKMFMPFLPGGADAETPPAPKAKGEKSDAATTNEDDQMDDLRAQLEQMQRQINTLTGGKK
ncbi:MAG: polyhydroxyalkanoate synthesis repressor PhaR [Alphaproteobacteria bacterium]|jgi:polyhydroxyalkanoate synthesis repressor PhaR|nr:polyhydroxyalkanoate synthesis repressor PhaR [Alphaproteobacteria bacterium]MBT7944242.1 polyhydroxyalkanoate synthesis repressor PhaR [Alphaproteobacteria bacterium]